MKSSSDGPSSRVWLNCVLDEDGVARHRLCGLAARTARKAVDIWDPEKRIVASLGAEGVKRRGPRVG